MAKVTLVNEVPMDIHVSDMQDGDIGVITSWNGQSYVGEVVQRYGDYNLVALGKCKGKGWDILGLIRKSSHPNCKVRLITEGTLKIGE